MGEKGARKFIVFFIISAIICLWGFITASAEQKGTVRGGWLILRSAPSYEGRQLSSYPTGTVVTITGQRGSWYAVTAPDGLKGYMLGKYLVIKESGSLKPGQEAWVTSQNGLNVRLRSGPGTQYAAIASYAPGTKCTILERAGSFYKIKIGKMTGYMMGKFLTGTHHGSDTDDDDEEEEEHQAGYTVYVTSKNGYGVNLRSGPSTSYNAIGFFEVGTKATMIKYGKTWCKISVNHLDGYMMTVFLTTSNPRKQDPYIPYSICYIYNPNGNRVNLRSGPGIDYSVVSTYPSGTEITLITEDDEWCFIKVKDKYGYMMRQFIVQNE